MEWLEQSCYICVLYSNRLALISVYEEVIVFIGQEITVFIYLMYTFLT